MAITTSRRSSELQYVISPILHELGIPVHRVGYKHLSMAIQLYAQNDSQSLTKELYPRIADAFGYSEWHPVEHGIRLALLQAWDNRMPRTWERYFPCSRKCPSNKQFIATIVEFLSTPKS